MNAQIKPIKDQVLEYLQGAVVPRSCADIAKGLAKETTYIHKIVHDLHDAGVLLAEAGPNRATVYSIFHDENLERTAPAQRPPARPEPVLVQSPTPPAVPPAPTPAAEITVRRRRRRMSNDEFMGTIEKMRRDSDLLARIRAILDESEDETEESGS